MSVTVTALSFCPVKGTRLRTVQRLEIGRAGAVGDRRFYVVDARDRMVNGKTIGALSTVVAAVEDEELSLTFPDGREVRAPIRHDGVVRARFYSQTREDRIVDGPWAQALSEHVGQPLRLAEADAGRSAIDRGARGGVSILSRGSLDRLTAQAAADGIDARRFRMTIEIDGVDAHEEDAWVGRRARIGSVTVRLHGHVGRCLITSRDPDTGTIDLPTLDLLGAYRGDIETTEPLPFGVFGEVLEPGTVAVGDPVEVD